LDYANPNCYVERVPATDSELTVKGCWNVVQGVVDPDQCTEKPFKYGQETTVTLSARGPAAQPQKTTLELRNETSESIEIVKDHCGIPQWFDLDMGENITTQVFCSGGCDEQYKPKPDPACGGCADDVIQTLAPGQAASVVWDARFFYQYPSGCQAGYVMPSGTQARAKLCWRKPGDAALRCAPTWFDLGQLTPATVIATP
jgi:hypothetical protein